MHISRKICGQMKLNSFMSHSKAYACRKMGTMYYATSSRSDWWGQCGAVLLQGCFYCICVKKCVTNEEIKLSAMYCRINWNQPGNLFSIFHLQIGRCPKSKTIHMKENWIDQVKVHFESYQKLVVSCGELPFNLAEFE